MLPDAFGVPCAEPYLALHAISSVLRWLCRLQARDSICDHLFAMLCLLLPCCRYALPRERGMFRLLSSPSDVTTRSIIQRIVNNRAAFEARNAKKVASEQAYYASSKDYVKEV